jgi:hypothetical protein
MSRERKPQKPPIKAAVKVDQYVRILAAVGAVVIAVIGGLTLQIVVPFYNQLVGSLVRTKKRNAQPSTTIKLLLLFLLSCFFFPGQLLSLSATCSSKIVCSLN